MEGTVSGEIRGAWQQLEPGTWGAQPLEASFHWFLAACLALG